MKASKTVLSFLSLIALGYIGYILIAPLFLTQPEKTYKVLKEYGYTNIEIKGHTWKGCAKYDFYSTRFSAIKDGRKVEGAYCSGLVGDAVRTF